jgi:type III pantothenate kinase
MNLIIDIGNTATKLAIYDGAAKLMDFRSKDFNCEQLEKSLQQGYKIDKAIISSVRDTPDYIIDLLKVNIPFVHVLTSKSKLPFKIQYETPETLGTDRIAAIAGAHNLFPGLDILIIDAGTAITYEFMSAGIYLGGNISPGLAIRFKALNKFTARLPLVSPKANYSFPGRNTSDAIIAGVITGVSYEINEYIRTFEKKHIDFKVILTGGDSGYLKDKIDYQITYEPDIVTAGLNYILDYNAK